MHDSIDLTMLADFLQWLHTDEFGSVEPGYERDRCEDWALEFLNGRDEPVRVRPSASKDAP